MNARAGLLAPSGSVLVGGAAAGIALGGAYAASPLSVWFLVATLGLFAWASRGLMGRERRYVLAILGVAVALRVLAIALLFLTTDHHSSASFFWDGDGLALKRRSLWIRNVWLGVPVTPFSFFVTFDRLYGWTTYLYILAYVQYWLGPAPYAVHLISVGLFLASAVALYRLARSAYGRQPALIGLAILLFLPTPFLWSVSALKESAYVFLIVTCLVATVVAVRGGFRRFRAGFRHHVLVRSFALLVVVASMSAIDGVRAGGQLLVAAGLGAGLVGSIIVRRMSLVLLVLVLVPLVIARALDDPSLQARVIFQLGPAVRQHIGNLRTEGHGYKLMDQRLYSAGEAEAIESMTPAEGARFAARAVASFMVVPLPWQAQSASELVFLPQQILWYGLQIFALVGLVAGVRRDALVTCLLAAVAVGGGAAMALNSGNIGTMVRHRDTVVPFVVWLSALGAVATVSTLMSHIVAGQMTSASCGSSLVSNRGESGVASD